MNRLTPRQSIANRWRLGNLPLSSLETAAHEPGTPTCSQPWGFIPLEIGIVSAEEQGLQVSVRDNRAGNPLPLDLEELPQSVDRLDNVPVNQSVVLG